MSSKPDLVDIVEAAYSLESDDDSWLERVLTTSEPHFNRGLGVYGFRFDATNPQAFRIWGVVRLGDALVMPELVVKWHQLLGPDLVWRMYSATKQYAPISERLGLGEQLEAHPAMQAMCGALGVVDQMTVRAVDPGQVGVTLCTPVSEYAAPSAADSRLWTRIATHVAAGHRLRARLRAEADASRAIADLPHTSDAVFDATGKLLHAAADARDRDTAEVLRDGVKAMDRARGRLRRESPDEALEVWRGLIEGTWSIVEHFDSDGRRLILARQNEPLAQDPQALSNRERQVVGYTLLGHSTKETAYALGVSNSSVKTQLARAMKKLHVESQAALIRLLQAKSTS